MSPSKDFKELQKVSDLLKDQFSAIGICSEIIGNEFDNLNSFPSFCLFSSPAN